MNEPPRLHIEPESELERSLLDAGRSYTASSSSRANVLAALGVVGLTASSTTAAAMTKAGAVKWLAATALLAGVAIPTVRYLAGHSAPASASASAAIANTAPAIVTIPSSASAATAAKTNESLPNAGDPAMAEPAVNGAANAVRVESKPAPASPLAAELSALDTARAALAAGNPTAALSGLDAYAHNFPHGKLSLEAEVLRIDALAKSGQGTAAQKRAQAFMKRHPDSMLASRVRAYVGQ